MNPLLDEYLVRQELEKNLKRGAVYEPWRHSGGLDRSSRERLGQRLVRQANEWLERHARPLPCNESLPACGLTPAA